MSAGHYYPIKFYVVSTVSDGNKPVEHADICPAVRTDRDGTVAVVPVPAAAGKDLIDRFARLKVHCGQIPRDCVLRNAFARLTRVEIARQ